VHYQSKLQPIDDEAGNFVLAICHGEHKIGGEDTRETQYARCYAGRVGQLNELRDLTSICLPPRAADREWGRGRERFSGSWSLNDRRSGPALTRRNPQPCAVVALFGWR